jgi:hypothetical protein
VWDADDDASGLQPLIVFFSAGNDGDGDFDGCGTAGSDQVSTPATAKNVITVAANETDRGCDALSNDVGDVASFSSRGPVDPDGTGQGLFKPDVTNVGTLVLSTEADGTGGSSWDAEHGPFSCSDTGDSYRYEAGTSMSCPLTAGLGGVVLQDLVVNRGVTSPKPSLVKALLVNGASDLQPSGGCNYTFDVAESEIHQGWGLVQATASLYGEGGSPTQRKVEFENEISAHAVATGGLYQRTIQVGAGGTLKVTLVWTDFPAAPPASSPLVVNDLDLEVSGPDGLFLGNNFVGDWSVDSTVSGTPDRYNVVENVYIQSVLGGSYTITVRGFQISQDQEPGKTGVNQDFSLVWSASSLSSPTPTATPTPTVTATPTATPTPSPAPAPDIDAPASLSFGSVAVGKTASLDLQIDNVGDATLIVTAITSDDPVFVPRMGMAVVSGILPLLLLGTLRGRRGNPGRPTRRRAGALLLATAFVGFLLSESSEAARRRTSLVIPVGGSAQVPVKFTPTDPVSYSAVLTITSNDPDEGSFLLPVSGQGI